MKAPSILLVITDSTCWKWSKRFLAALLTIPHPCAELNQTTLKGGFFFSHGSTSSCSSPVGALLLALVLQSTPKRSEEHAKADLILNDPTTPGDCFPSTEFMLSEAKCSGQAVGSKLPLRNDTMDWALRLREGIPRSAQRFAILITSI